MTRRVVAVFTVLLMVAAGLSFYALQLKRRVAHDEQLAAQQQLEAAPPAAGAVTPVALYLASDADATLKKVRVDVVLPPERSERARSVLRALLEKYLQPTSPHRIGAGSDVRNVYLLDDGTAIVDTNAAFADSHPSGVLAEELTVTSLVTTLNANDAKIMRVKVLVNGQERETLAGHADLRRFYDAGNVIQLARDLQ